MPLCSDVENVLELLDEVQNRLIGTGSRIDSSDPRILSQVNNDLNTLLSVLSNPVFQRICKIQDSVTELGTQLIRHPSCTTNDFDITPEGALVLKISPAAERFRPTFDATPIGKSIPSVANVPPAVSANSPSSNTPTTIASIAGTPPPKVIDFDDAPLAPITTPTYAQEFDRVVQETSLGREIHTIQLYKPEGSSLGFSVVGLKSQEKGELGIFVQEIQPSGIAARDGRLAEGDQILAIDGQPLDSAITHQQAIGILQQARGEVEIVVARAPESLLPVEALVPGDTIGVGQQPPVLGGERPSSPSEDLKATDMVGEELKHSVGSGIIMSNQSLVLQGINRKAAGNYTCIATNAEGSSHSNAVLLSVMYSAVCLTENGVTVGASKGETVGLRCAVEANPTALDFEWEFHGAGDNVDVVPAGKTQSHGDLSRFFYTPQTDSEFGTFLCWASNKIGRQVQPCVFHVVAAVKPHPLENCSVVNQTRTMIHVECSHHRELPPIPDQPLFRIMNEDSENPNAHQDPAQYGLFPEYYVMEVWDLKNRSIRRNLSAESPVFILKNLLPGSMLRLILYAANSHGKSDSIVIDAAVAGDAEKQPLGASTSQMELLPLVLVGIGMACIGTLVIFILALIVRSRICSGGMGSRGRSSTITNNSHCEKPNSIMPPSGVTNNTMTLTSTNNSSGALTGYRPVPQSKHEADSNPDIIPGANNSFSTDYIEDPCKRTLSRKGLFLPSGGGNGMAQENCQPLLQHNNQGYAVHTNQNQHSLSHTLPRQLPSSHNNHHPLNGGTGGTIAAHGPSPNYPSHNNHSHHYEYEEDFEPSPVYHHHTLQHPLHPNKPSFPNEYASHPLQGHNHALGHGQVAPPPTNDFNTIYIREKLFRDSDIPESCV